MKKLVLILLLLCSALALSSCKKEAATKTVYVETLKLSRHEPLALQVGGSYTFKYSIGPSSASNKRVVWSTTNPQVATVDENGTLRAVAEGSCEVVVTSRQVSSLSDRCTVNVSSAPVGATGVHISPSEVILKKGATINLVAVLEPATATNQQVSWSTGNSLVAEVSEDGVLTAVDYGETTVKVVTDDGGFKDTVPVKVVRPYTSVKITSPDINDSFNYNYISNEDVSEYLVGDSFKLTYEALPADADDEVEIILPDNASRYMSLANDGTVSFNEPCVETFSIEVRAKSDHSVHDVLKFRVYSVPTSISVTGEGSYVAIGEGRQFEVKVSPATAPKWVVWSSQMGSANLVFSRTDSGDLYVTAPDDPRYASTSSNPKTSTVKLRFRYGSGIGCDLYKDFSFKSCLYSAEDVKPGDGITINGEILDSGWRGNGIYETPKSTSRVYAIIGYVGSIGNDPMYYKSAYRPNNFGCIKNASGESMHGIAIPVNTSHLYRTDAGDDYLQGEKYQGSGHRSQILKSDHLPAKMIKDGLVNKNYLVVSAPYSGESVHSAYQNTVTHAYCNFDRGKDDEARPFNFFVTDEILKPAKDYQEVNWSQLSGNIEVMYSFLTPYAGSRNGLSANSPSSTGCRGVTPWLLPTEADMFEIFAGTANVTGRLSNNAVVEERVNLYTRSAKLFGGVDVDYWNKVWWTSNEIKDQDNYTIAISLLSAPSVMGGKSFNSLSKDKDDRAYVLPVVYF